jgi:hypothetical protein
MPGNDAQPVKVTYEELTKYVPNVPQKAFHGSTATFKLAWGG